MIYDHVWAAVAATMMVAVDVDAVASLMARSLVVSIRYCNDPLILAGLPCGNGRHHAKSQPNYLYCVLESRFWLCPYCFLK